MLRTMAAAYEVAQLRGRALHPASFCGSPPQARPKPCGSGDRIGTPRAGIRGRHHRPRPRLHPAIAQRAARAEDIWEALFPTIMMGDDRAIAATYVAGKLATP
jgi:guanine deaminase